MHFRLNRLELTSGEVVVASSDMTVIVGPNNVGKSVLLASAWQRMAARPDHPPLDTRVVANVELSVPAVEALTDRLETVAKRRPPGQYPQGMQYQEHFLLPNNTILPVSRLQALFAEPVGSMLGELAPIVAMHLSPEARLGQLGGAPTPNLLVEEPAVPLQMMWADRTFEDRVRDVARRAFDVDLTVNRHAGSTINLHLGRPSTEEPKIGERSGYLQEVATLPAFQEQGHGVQAFLGMVTTLMARTYDIVLIDEPEAFLHPPQARLLGQLFVELSRQGSQLIVSTHSDDFLQGVLTASGTQTDVSVVRLTRPMPTFNAVAQVAPPALRQLYEDPLLRYSNILSGVFYRGVVFCEAESDCRYYAAVLENREADSRARSDILFTQCGGKDRFAKGVGALLAARVPTAVIADVDLLADEAKFTELFSLMGGDASLITVPLNDLNSFVRSQRQQVEREYVKFRLDRILKSRDDSFLDPGEVGEVRELLKSRSGWELVKKNGRGALARGGPVSAFDTLLRAAVDVGIFLVPVGELERFHPNIGGTKQRWLRQVFEEGVFLGSTEASDFVGSVADFIQQQQ